MAKNVYFVRHGETIANLKGVVAGGQDDSPLTDKGKIQAAETAEALKGIRFDLVASSPISRTIDSAEIIADRFGIESDNIVQVPEFTERDVGDYTGRPKAKYFAFEKSGGESGENTQIMQDRVRSGLRWLKQQDFSNALVVTHNGTIRMIRTVLEDLPAKEFAFVPHLNNGNFYKIELDDYEI